MESNVRILILDASCGPLLAVFVPLATWAMLLAGNHRCARRDGLRSIRDTVDSDIATSVSVHERLERNRAKAA